MAILMAELVQGFENLVCVQRGQSMQEALDIMLERGFTQLPVIDSERTLVGVISEHSILKKQCTIKNAPKGLAKPKVGELTVIDCLDEDMGTPLSPLDDIFEAVRRLETTSYVIVADTNRVPVGIITSYDTGKVFGAIGEVLVLARDIEVRLDEYVTRAYSTPETLKSALSNPFSDKGSIRSGKDPDRLTFGDLVTIIEDGTNWKAFGDVLGPKSVFQLHMKPAVKIRNDIAHFRRQVDADHDIPTMRNSLSWLYAHERLPIKLTVQARVALVGNASASASGTVISPVATPNFPALTDWLRSQRGREHDLKWPIVVRFDDIAQLLLAPLPPAALEHPSWWANDIQQPQSQAWLSAGWRVVDANLPAKQVTFIELLPNEIANQEQ